MIKNLLEQKKQILRIRNFNNSLNEAQAYLIDIYEKAEVSHNKTNVVVVPQGKNAGITQKEGNILNGHAYYLPWMQDTGYHFDLPANDTAVSLFLTAELTGCCVGVQKLENGLVRVCHYNVQNSEFDRSDFERYNSENSIRHWLVPKRYKNVIAGANIYSAYPTCFWGEKEGTEWKFYYQLPTGEICDFPYL